MDHELKRLQLNVSQLAALFGGEASKLLMLLKQSGKSYRDLMDEQRRYNLVTKEGAEGAMAGNRAITNLQTVFSSALAEISGQLGNELAPDIRRLTDDMAEWFKGGGIKRIVSFLRNDLYPGVLTFGQGIVFVGKVAYALAKKLSWLLPDERSDQRDVLKSLAMTGSVDIARMTAQRNGQGEWFEQQLKEKPGLPDDVKKSYRDTRGIFSDDNEGFDKSLDKYLTPENSGPLFGLDRAQSNSASASGDGGYWDALLQRLDTADQQPQARQLTDNRKFEYRFEINGAPGQSEQGIADAVEGVTKTSPAFTGNSSMMDGGQIW